jgi:hypothetical protein
VNKINIFEALAANANGGMVTWPQGAANANGGMVTWPSGVERNPTCRQRQRRQGPAGIGVAWEGCRHS